MFEDAVYISVYTRAQAIEDGVLVDVSTPAQEAGITWPVAVTAAVWALIGDIPPEHSYQSVEGRLWDVLCMLRYAIKLPQLQLPGSTETEIHYRLVMHHHCGEEPDSVRDGVKRVLEGHDSDRELITLKALSGPGDEAEPVITIMLPHED